MTPFATVVDTRATTFGTLHALLPGTLITTTLCGVALADVVIPDTDHPASWALMAPPDGWDRCPNCHALVSDQEW